MRFGLYLGVGDPQLPVERQIEQWAEMMRLAGAAGFTDVAAPYHWVSYPVKFFSPLVLMARLAAEPGNWRLATGTVQLPLVNPVDLAEQVATVDALCGGRFTLGASIGYREQLFEAAGVRRSERAGRFEEAVELMKKLWTGDEVTHHGRYFHLTAGRMGFTPVQKPHPPIWVGAQSDGAAERAGRLGDGLLAPPQSTIDDIRRHGEVFHQARRARGLADRGPIGAYRNLCVAERRDEAYRLAESVLPGGWAYYKKVGLQEQRTVELVLPFEREVRERALVGDPAEVAERVQEYAEAGVTVIYIRLIQAGWSQQMPTDSLRVLCEQVLPRVPVG
ncbi:MAG: LLM class flavin-dependent oxidoreductase [Chloroflexi bacterium]|nr:LLM class flavin-dependent oxidoreductase [Chloroflexota bacterium]